MSVRRLVDRVRRRVATDGVGALAAEAARRAYRHAAFGTQGAHVEVSNCCNFDCEYCVLSEGASGPRVMSDETFERVLPFLTDANYVQLSGLAEPLMNTRLPGMITRIRAVAPKARILIATNGSLLTREMDEALVRAGLTNLDVSLDGTDPELVDGIRRGGSLDALVGNIRTLQKVKQELGSSTPELAVAVVLQRRTVGMLPGVVRLAAELGAAAVSVNGLEPYLDEQAADALWIDPSQVEGLRQAVADAGEVASDAGISLRFASLRPRPAGCLAVQRPLVMADGTVVPCSALAYSRHSVVRVTSDGAVELSGGRTERVAFGNVNDMSLGEIWKDGPYREFRHQVSSGDFPDPCRDCLIKHGVICQGLTPEPGLDASEVLATLRV